MPYDEFAKIRDIENKLFKANQNKLMSNFSSLTDFINKTPSCPKCKASETFLNHNDEYECAVCSYNWH